MNGAGKDLIASSLETKIRHTFSRWRIESPVILIWKEENEENVREGNAEVEIEKEEDK